MTSRVVFDIETLGFPFESFDEVRQDYLMKFAKSEEEKTDVIQKLSLYPTTAQVIAIGMMNPDSGKGKIFFQADSVIDKYSEDGLIHFQSGSERDIITSFWELITKYDQFITFNGRGFDSPFLLLRSAILGIKATRNLLPYRYSHQAHCDLLEQFTFYNATRKFNLDFYCKSFSIESPKASGITGLDMRLLFEEKRFFDIANYCLGDLRATTELFLRWKEFISLDEE